MCQVAGSGCTESSAKHARGPQRRGSHHPDEAVVPVYLLGGHTRHGLLASGKRQVKTMK